MVNAVNSAEKLHVGVLLEKLIIKYGISQVEFARLVGRTPSDLSAFIKGKKEINTSTLLEYCTGMPIDMMVEYLTIILNWAVEHNHHNPRNKS